MDERKKRANKIVKKLQELFPDAAIVLKYSNTWELLVSVILSAQCTDKQVNIVTEKLFKKYITLEDYVKVDLEEFEDDIKSTGFYHNKAKNILASAKIVKEKFGGAENFNKVLFTTAMAKWDNMGLSPVDMAILESKVHDLRTLCNIYSVQSQIFNDPANKTFNNQKEAKKAAMTDAIMPLLNSLRDELNGWLVANYSKVEGRKLFLSPDWKSVPVLQEDIQKLVNWLMRAWWLTPNQRLEIQGIERSQEENMNKIYIPNNLVELEKHNTAPSQFSLPSHSSDSTQ